MSGAMREHAPSSTRLTGLVSATALTLAMGYIFANGMNVDFTRIAPDPIAYVALPDEPRPEPPPTVADALDMSDDTRLDAPPVEIDLPLFETDTVIGNPDGSVAPGSGTGTNPGAGGSPAPRTPVSVRARLIPGDLPPYPTSLIRKRQEGDSGLEVCINASGRVTAASIASTSGNALLDDAALKWVRTSRFKPATVDGAPQSVCGHPVTYEWRIKVIPQ